MSDTILSPSLFARLRAAWAKRLRRRPPAKAISTAKRAETRERLFTQVSRLVHEQALHAAPDVALRAVFSVRDGRRTRLSSGARSALSQERVDMLIIDREAHPILAIDHAADGPPSRAERARIRAKINLFQRAGLPLVVLHGLDRWDTDRAVLLSRLSEILADGAHTA